MAGDLRADTLIFPYAYDWAGLHGSGTPASYPWFFPGLIAVRNALLVIATARFIRRSLARTESARDLARSTTTAA